MSALIIGDIHNKQHFILTMVDEYIKELDPDQVIFLGDYVDDFGSSDSDVVSSLMYQLDWYNEKSDYIKEKITFLLGNHDMAYIIGDNYCSGHHDLIDVVMQDLYKKLPYKFAEIVEGTYLATHAGVTQTWYDLVKGNNDSDIFSVVDTINTTSNKLLYYACFEVGGVDPCSGPLWVRPGTLTSDPLKGIDQIVGHTPVPSCSCSSSTKIEDSWVQSSIYNEMIWFADTFSTHRDGTPVGNGTILYLSNQVMNVLKPDEITNSLTWY